MPAPVLRHRLGQAGEALAAEVLKRSGYTILDRNYRTPYGEIDLIAWHDGNLVFIEVKLRRSATYGSPAEGITDAKKRRIISSAQFYLQQADALEARVRFDVVSILVAGGRPKIEIIPDAFVG